MLRRLDDIRAQPVRRGEVVRAAAGDVAQWHVDIRRGEAVDDLVERPVAAGTADQLIIPAEARGESSAVALFAGNHRGDLIARVHQDADYLRDVAQYHALARHRIYYQQRRFQIFSFGIIKSIHGYLRGMMRSDQTIIPATIRQRYAVGMEKSRLSARSNMPPWPGIRFEKSFTPIMRLTSDSARSPI